MDSLMRNCASKLAASRRPGMTTELDDIASRSRGTNCPSFVQFIVTLNREGAGNAGCWPHPRALRAKEMHFAHASNVRAAGTTGTPCAMVYGLYVISSVRR